MITSTKEDFFLKLNYTVLQNMFVQITGAHAITQLRNLHDVLKIVVNTLIVISEQHIAANV